MSTEQTSPAAAPSGPISLDQFVAEMDAEQAAPAVEDEDDAPVEAAADDEAPAEIEEPEFEDEEEPEAAPIPDPPVSWSKEDREGWAELTPKAREIVLRREADRDKAVSQAVQKASEATKAVQVLSEQTNQIAHLATDAFERKWQEKTQGPIQWAALARQMDPAEYQALRADYEADKVEVERASKAAAEQSQLARSAFLTEEWEKLTKIAPELTDPKEGQARRAKVAEYLVGEGIPGEAVGDASAVEWKIAWKAMRFDMMEAKAKEQSALPRKNPVASSPKPVRPVGSGDASPQRNLQGLSQKLTKSGKLDDFVALMDAEQAQATRKAIRK